MTYREQQKRIKWADVHSTAVAWALIVSVCFGGGFIAGYVTGLARDDRSEPNMIVSEEQEAVAPVEEWVDKPDTVPLGQFKITAYCPCKSCCGKWANGITSTGATAQANRTIAVDPDIIPYGSLVLLDGVSYVAEDCGGAIKGKRIDVYFPTHEEALAYGVQRHQVYLAAAGEGV